MSFHEDFSKSNEGIFITRPLIAVVDNDIIDDNFDEDPSGQNTEYDGTDDGSDDRTIWAELGGVLRAEYYRGGKLVTERQVTVCTRQHRRLVKLNIISMKSRTNNQPYWTKQEILREIGRLGKTWAQACIRFVNRNGQEITETDIQERDQPQGVDIDSDGLEECTIDPQQNKIYESVEERELINVVKDNDDLTIDIIFINQFTDPQIFGESFPDSAIAYGVNPNLKRIVIIAKITLRYEIWNVTPHEIGHILLDATDHFLSQDVNETYRNLMRGLLSWRYAVDEVKRLIQNQIDKARQSPLVQ